MSITPLVDLVARSLLSTSLLLALLSAVAVMVGMAFQLTLGGAIAIYFVVWWTVLFVILPVRISSQAEVGQVTAGSDPGAPASPAVRERAIWTTIVSVVVFALVAALFPLAGV